MPYELVPINSGWKVRNTRTGAVYSRNPVSKQRALAQMRLLYMIERSQPKLRSRFFQAKQADGRTRWIAISSTAFKDRDGHIVTREALRADVERADAEAKVLGPRAAYGPLRWYHLGRPRLRDLKDWRSAESGSGVDIGYCDFNMLAGPTGSVLIESGLYDDEDIARAFSNVDVEMSIAFAHPPDQPVRGEFTQIKRIERSLLPRGKASNLFTTFVGATHKQTSTWEDFMDAERIKLLENLGVPQDVIDKLLRQAALIEKAGQEAGIERKEALEFEHALQAVEQATQQVVKAAAALAEATSSPPPPPPPPTPAKRAVTDLSVEEFEDFLAETLKRALSDILAEQPANEDDTDAAVTKASFQRIDKALSSLVDAVTTLKAKVEAFTDGAPSAVIRGVRPTESPDNELAAEQLKAKQVPLPENPFAWIDGLLSGNPSK